MGTDGGVFPAYVCMCCVFVCAVRVHITLLGERLGRARGLLELAVFLGTLPLDGLRVRVRDGQAKDERQADSRGIIIYSTGRLKKKLQKKEGK